MRNLAIPTPHFSCVRLLVNIGDRELFREGNFGGRKLARQSQDCPLADALAARIALYEAARPYRQPSTASASSPRAFGEPLPFFAVGLTLLAGGDNLERLRVGAAPSASV
jgi:hypothetical protein